MDDLLIIGKELAGINNLKAKLKAFHPMKDGGLVNKLLGIQFD